MNKKLTADFLLRQSNGSIELDGRIVKPANVEQIGLHKYTIILKEGIKRQIRRMAEHCGYVVVDLQRIRIDSIVDANLKIGQWRNLTAAEVMLLSA